MKKLTPLILLFMLAVTVGSVSADEGITPYVVGTTMPVSSEVMSAVDALLAANPPADTPYYAITYIQPDGFGYYVSVAGMYISSPEDSWSLENAEQVAWIGTLHLDANDTGGYDGEYFTVARVEKDNYKLASLKLGAAAAGGGSYIAFPWQYGKSVIYGTLGVHGEGGYGSSGLHAIDLIVGDDLGSNFASATVYAADPGTIDYVCNDTGSVAVRTTNGAGDLFIYAHLIDNASLAINQSFARGEAMGTLKYGSFTHPAGEIDCGWADQKDNHAHLHWMFDPDNGYFQAESCFINVTNDTITCPTGDVHPGGVLYGGGGSGVYDASGETDGTAPDDFTARAASNTLSFFDYLVIGAIKAFDRGIIKLLPEHSTAAFRGAVMVVNTAKVVLNVARVLLHGNINVGPLLAAFIFFGSITLLEWTIRGAWVAFQIVRTLIKII